MDMISRQAAIEPKAISEWKKEFREYVDSLDITRDDWKGIIEYIDEIPSAQPEHTETHSCDCERTGTRDDAQPRWIPFETREPDAEEKQEHPEFDLVLCGKLPQDGQRILVSIKYKGHEAVEMDEYTDDGGECYLDSGYDIATEATAWMPLPEPYKGEQDEQAD